MGEVRGYVWVKVDGALDFVEELCGAGVEGDGAVGVGGLGEGGGAVVGDFWRGVRLVGRREGKGCLE